MFVWEISLSDSCRQLQAVLAAFRTSFAALSSKEHHYYRPNRTGPNLLSTKAVYCGVEFQESRRKWRTKNLWPPAEGGAMSKSTAGGKSKRYLWHGSDNLHISFQSAHSIPTFIKPMQFHLPILGISPVGHYNCCFYIDNFVSNQNYFYSRNKFSWLYFISNKIYFLLLFFLSFILNFSNFKFTICDFGWISIHQNFDKCVSFIYWK